MGRYHQSIHWIALSIVCGSVTACSTEWDDAPKAFAYNDQSWQMHKINLELTGVWVNAPPNLTESQMRYYATRAFEEYAGCKIAAASMDVTASGAAAQMTC